MLMSAAISRSGTRPAAIDAIQFRMEQQGLSVKDKVPYFGSVRRSEEILSGRRRLTAPMIRKLYRGVGIPLECLV